MSQKKMVRRDVAVALGIVCILLIAALGGAMVYYTITINDKNNQINSINAELAAITGNYTSTNVTETINQLNANIANLTNENNHLQAWLTSNITAATNYADDHGYTNEQYQNLQNQVNGLNDIIDLKESTGWINQTISNSAGHIVTWKPSTSISYAGYVLVQVKSLTGNNNTFVEMAFSATNYNADVRQLVGTSGTVVFPILPTTNLEVNFGTSDGSAASENVIMIYYY
jgi:predicted PurR-regulated permease PerM